MSGELLIFSTVLGSTVHLINTTAAKIFQPSCNRCTAITGACDVLLTRSSGGPSSASSDDCSSPILLQESIKKQIN